MRLVSGAVAAAVASLKRLSVVNAVVYTTSVAIGDPIVV